MMSVREWQQAHRDTRYERVYGYLLGHSGGLTAAELCAVDGCQDAGTMRAVLREGEELGHFIRQPGKPAQWFLSYAERSGVGYVTQ